MLTKNDLILLLSDLENQGEDINKEMIKIMKTDGVSLDVLKFINDRRQLDVAAFYEILRKNHNQKKSPLYKNLVKEEFDPDEVISTLAALNLQISLFAKKLPDTRRLAFTHHCRAGEICEVLGNYYSTYDLIPCLKMLKLIKADLKAFESIK